LSGCTTVSDQVGAAADRLGQTNVGPFAVLQEIDLFHQVVEAAAEAHAPATSSTANPWARRLCVSTKVGRPGRGYDADALPAGHEERASRPSVAVLPAPRNRPP